MQGDVRSIQLFSFCFEEQVKPLVQSGELDVHPLQLQLKRILTYQVGHPWLIILSNLINQENINSVKPNMDQ